MSVDMFAACHCMSTLSHSMSAARTATLTSAAGPIYNPVWRNIGWTLNSNTFFNYQFNAAAKPTYALFLGSVCSGTPLSTVGPSYAMSWSNTVPDGGVDTPQLSLAYETPAVLCLFPANAAPGTYIPRIGVHFVNVNAYGVSWDNSVFAGSQYEVTVAYDVVPVGGKAQHQGVSVFGSSMSSMSLFVKPPTAPTNVANMIVECVSRLARIVAHSLCVFAVDFRVWKHVDCDCSHWHCQFVQHGGSGVGHLEQHFPIWFHGVCLHLSF